MDHTSRFVDQEPTDQNILDLFAGEWSSAMPSWSGLKTIPGHASLFFDSRMILVQEHLGPIKGANVLELGPLEGAHTYMLNHFGASSVTAIEANTRAFLKCLCVKEVFGLDRAHFKLGSFVPFLETCPSYDILIACGVLYHMTEPLKLLDLVVQRSDRIFLWTHYFDAETIAGRHDAGIFAPVEELAGTSYLGAKRLYPEAALSWAGFSGGTDSYAVWVERESLLRYFDDRGFTVTMADDHKDHVNGPAFSLCATKR